MCDYEVTGPDNGSIVPAGRNEVDTVNAVNRFRRLTQEIYEHHFRQLWVAVNGVPVGSLAVRAELNEATLYVNINEPVGFVEVFSEHKVRLAILNVDLPQHGAPDQRRRTALSDGRMLEVGLSFSGPRPTAHLIYYEPELDDFMPYAASHMELVH